MATFTRPNGDPIDVPASSVSRARPTLTNEIFEKKGHVGTALFKPKQLVLEPISTVGPALQAELPSFAMLHAPNGAEIWFDAKEAQDARPPRSSETSPDTQAVVAVGGVAQRVSESVAAAQAIIDAARAA